MTQFNLSAITIDTDELIKRAERIGGFHNIRDFYPDATIEEIAQEYVDNYVTNCIDVGKIAHYLSDCYLEDIGAAEDFNGETL